MTEECCRDGGLRCQHVMYVPEVGREVRCLPLPPPRDGFAVHGNRALLTRRNHNRRTVELTRAEFDGANWTSTSRCRLRVPGRVVMRPGQGRDGYLLLRTGNSWLRFAA